MTLGLIELLIRWAGGILAYGTLGVIFWGLWKGTRRAGGRVSGKSSPLLRSAWFYAITSAAFLGICMLGWVPLPLHVTSSARVWMLVSGSVLLFPGLSLVLLGRLTLGRNYFVSTSQGAQLFAGHQLVKTGIYASVRHPMYLGLMMAAAGSLLIYMTWTTVFFEIFAPFILLRARREDAALAAEFGEEWRQYGAHVHAFIPRFGKKGESDDPKS